MGNNPTNADACKQKMSSGGAAAFQARTFADLREQVFHGFKMAEGGYNLGRQSRFLVIECNHPQGLNDALKQITHAERERSTVGWGMESGSWAAERMRGGGASSRNPKISTNLPLSGVIKK